MFFCSSCFSLSLAFKTIFTADSSSIEGRMSFLADCFALYFLAEATPLSFLAAEAFPES
jgi:hypothetical protein